MFNPSRPLPISVIIPAYQAEPYIRNALQSVAAQTRPPAEVIVVDDGSSDRTAELAAEFGATVIRFSRNAGPSAARNAGIAQASEPWIAFLDADDVWMNDKLATQWEALARWPDAGFCFSDYDVVDADGHVRSREMATNAGYVVAKPSARSGSAVRFERGALVGGLVRSMFIRQSSAIIDRRLLRNSGSYDERLRLGEDYDLFLRIIDEAPGIAIERPLVAYHRRAASLSNDPIAEIESIDRLWMAILERPDRYPATVVGLISEQRPVTLAAGYRLGLRLGRFAEALAFARKADQSNHSLEGWAMQSLAKALDNQAGQTAYRVARSVWRSRPRGTPPVLHHDRQFSR